MLPNKVHNVAKKDIPLLLRGQLGLQRTDGRFYLLVEIERATVRHSVVLFGISSQAQRLQIEKSRTSEFLVPREGIRIAG
jgi:hypothetical protein